MIPGNEIEISIDGYTIAAREWGTPGAQPILALHGWLDNANSFNLLAPLIKDAHIIAMDFIGHGHSSHLHPEAIYHFTDATIHIQQVLSALNWKQVILLGHSMGGALACMTAGLFPQAIKGMIIMEGLGPLSEDVMDARSQLLEYVKMRNKILNKKQRVYTTLEMAAIARSQKGYLGLDESRILAERGTKITPEGYVWRHDPRLLLPSPIRLQEEQVLSFLRNITCPVVFIQGKNGFSYDPLKMQQRYQAVTQLQHHTIPGGHHMHMEHPDIVANIINLFFADNA